MKPINLNGGKLNGLGICSGIGGIEYALEPWVNWIAGCERERYPAAVLLGNARIPIWDNVETFPWNDFKGYVDIVAAGFPCQDVSVAGKRQGLGGKRSILVFQIIEGCRRMESSFIMLENVPNVLGLMGSDILRCLDKNGYDARWITLRVPNASPIGEGKRWFLLAKTKGITGTETSQAGNAGGTFGKAWPMRLWGDWEKMAEPNWEIPSRWILRNRNELSRRLDRVKALGNAVVPEQAREAFQILSGLKLNYEEKK